MSQNNLPTGCRWELGDTKERHGVISLVTGEGHPEAVREHFLLNLYRLFTQGKCWTIPRGEPFESERTDNTLTLTWQPTDTLPVAMRATYELQGDADLRLRIWVKAARDLPKFELFTSSYFHLDYQPYCVLAAKNHQDEHTGEMHGSHAMLWQLADHPYIHGLYTHLKRDEEAVINRLDGRWDKPDGTSIAPSSHGLSYAWPVTVMAHPTLKNAGGDDGILIVQSTPRASCDSALMTYRGDPQKDHIADHNATYFSLFCRDLKEGEEAEVEVHQAVRCCQPTLENIRAAIPTDFQVD